MPRKCQQEEQWQSGVIFGIEKMVHKRQAPHEVLVVSGALERF